jgi:RNA polymerase-binding transcription factor DksA
MENQMALTAQQRKHLEKRLHEERNRAISLLNRIIADRTGSSDQDQSGDLTSMPLHQADLGTDTINRELDESNATRISLEINEMDIALEKLYKTPDKFGICENTGEDIPFARLDIIPWARTCE